jgi:hypothetical protein
MLRAHLAGRLAALLVIACVSTFAGATSQRTFVRSDGVDNPSCSLAAPCRQFAAAVAAASANGEVIVLDSAGYGPVTISKSVSLIAPVGVYAGISVFTGDGVTIAAGATDKVVLRGITINGQGGANGIVFSQGAILNVEDCQISNMAVDGIAASAVNSQVIVKNTVLRHNAGSGFSIAGASGNAQATLEGVHLTNNATGLYATGNTTAIITDSVISGNTTGLQGYGPAIGITTIVSSHNKITRNSTGVLASATLGLVYAMLDGNLLSRNSTAVSIGGGSLGYTSGNNVYTNNSSDGSVLLSNSPK